MMYWVPTADGLKRTEEGNSPDSCGLGMTFGGRPKSIRKRGRHRALRRGIMWFICAPSQLDSPKPYNFARIFVSILCPDNTGFAFWPKDDQ